MSIALIYANLDVFQGDLEKLREGVVFLTVHGAGKSFNTWLDFAGDVNMEDIRKRWVMNNGS